MLPAGVNSRKFRLAVPLVTISGALPDFLTTVPTPSASLLGIRENEGERHPFIGLDVFEIAFEDRPIHGR